MTYIKRTLEESIKKINEDYSCLLLIGPRQVGKTTMLEHLMDGGRIGLQGHRHSSLWNWHRSRWQGERRLFRC